MQEFKKYKAYLPPTAGSKKSSKWIFTPIIYTIITGKIVINYLIEKMNIFKTNVFFKKYRIEHVKKEYEKS